MAGFISQAVVILRRSTVLTDEAVSRLLVAEGVERDLAARLVVFLPMAYCRLLLSRSGVRFSDNFRRLLPDGSISTEKPLSSEPVWESLVTFAQSEIERGMAEHDILAVAGRSAEFHAVNQLLQSGSRLENVVLSTPVLTSDL